MKQNNSEFALDGSERAASSRVWTNALASEGYQQVRRALAKRKSSATMEEELWRGETLQLSSTYIDALRRVHLDTGTAHCDLAGDNVIEIDRNYWRNIVVRIRII